MGGGLNKGGRAPVPHIPEPQLGDGQKPIRRLGPKIGHNNLVREDKGADTRVGLKPPTNPGRYDEVVGVTFERGTGERTGDGCGSKSRTNPTYKEINPAPQGARGCVGCAATAAWARQAPTDGQPTNNRRTRQPPCHRVPFRRNRGGHQHPAKPNGSDYASFFSVNDHSPLVEVVPPSWIDTRVVLPVAPYWVLKNTLPGIVR
ncbi:hypothetical protein OK074_8870 [Actinobacteria bacterium OK074]|nr:hypothetical protein OK074_8870 [Actinobacteria bacterium OK074]